MEGIVLFSIFMILMGGSAYGATLTPTPSPAPAPAPDHVNLTHLLSYAGEFHTFLDMLESTKVLDTFQNQANNSVDGITIFVPTDDAFSSLKKPSISNLTNDQLKALVLFHALPKFYSFSQFVNLSEASPVSTYGGSLYSLNFTDDAGRIHVYSGWTTTKIGSAVFSTYPVAVYQVDKVLLPEAIFGTAPPPAPTAPAPAPDSKTPADVNSSAAGKGSDLTASPPSVKSLAAPIRQVSTGFVVFLISAFVLLFLV